jgi:hypothetical protein
MEIGTYDRVNLILHFSNGGVESRQVNLKWVQENKIIALPFKGFSGIKQQYEKS